MPVLEPKPMLLAAEELREGGGQEGSLGCWRRRVLLANLDFIKVPSSEIQTKLPPLRQEGMTLTPRKWDKIKCSDESFQNPIKPDSTATFLQDRKFILSH
jgi:hypothetical protein